MRFYCSHVNERNGCSYIVRGVCGLELSYSSWFHILGMRLRKRGWEEPGQGSQGSFHTKSLGQGEK